MQIAEYCIHKRVITYLLSVLVLTGGLVVYPNLGRFEDPGVAIKTCPVITPYPGASPEEVEAEVTDVIESALQSMWQVKEVTSVSQAGLSIVKADFKDTFRKADLPQIYDEVRRKVADVQKNLPPGAQPSMVNDDFGDEYGILFAITGDGYSYKELSDYAEFLRKELLPVPGVARIVFWGEQPEIIAVEISRAKLGQLGIPLDSIFQLLQQQNVVANAGMVQSGDERMRIALSGTAASWEALGDLLLAGAESAVRLRDVATLVRDVQSPPSAVLRIDGQPAIGFGISTEEGGNVVAMGDAVRARLDQLESRRPVGMELHVISFQGETVRAAVSGFVISVFQALAIVVGVLMIFMGLRSGLIIGAVLLLIVGGTFILMQAMSIELQRISLGALIVALGMLVDNAIVITDGILVRIGRGEDRIKAAGAVVGQTIWPLLGATLVAIMAFAAIGFSPDSTGEYCKSLFQVIAISLLLSWLLAVTVTPLLCVDFLRAPKAGVSAPKEGRMTGLYRRFLHGTLVRRKLVMAVMAGLMVLGIYGFGKVPPAFFPQSARPQFVLDYWLPQGTHIDRTLRDTRHLEEFVMNLDGVESVATWVGRGAIRFMLVYAPEDANAAYAQLLITVKDFQQIPELIETIRAELDSNYLDAQCKLWKFVLGPGGGSAIEVRFSGEDPLVLRDLCNQARAIMQANPLAVNIKDDWRQPVRITRAVVRDEVAAQLGVTRPEIAATLEVAGEGRRVGVYREGEDVLPILARLPEIERNQRDQLDLVTVTSRLTGENISLQQLISGWKTEWENALVLRRDRERTITAQCDPASGPSIALLNELRPLIEAIPLPEGYKLAWGGEYEDSTNANAGIASTMPLTFLIMVVLIVMLFNAFKQAAIIFLTVPLAVVGVAAGLLITKAAFDFMATLGFLSLAGMLIKNSVVLIDQMDLEMRSGKPALQAIIDSTIDRTRPVLMAAVTTVLGLVPLLTDVFFQGLAVVIMFGLSFAAVLTLVVVPVLYAAFFKVKAS
ncbi:MAG TPA: efflux RND transporter permease subunit [Kiritimatiellia bacterium]|nr:efflux RND transporter permease subunit [Kiritimatiellia bacterium]HMP00377.1 efflux RND transporter permease subunit [Kiritimatiellia bacterium]HMP83427.1 efflux RND transporter permease subunit [Verrucomicrobiota bacterium]